MSAIQKRRAPAFQEYAADMLAYMRYRMMSLEEKGLLHLLRNECWVNDQIPAKIEELAPYLGIEINKLTASLTERVLSFFIEVNGFLISPELNAYRAQLTERSNKLATGGSKGGKSTQNKNKNNQARLEALLKPVRREDINKVELKSVEFRTMDSSVTAEFIDPWVSEYEASPDAPTPYLIASRGS